MNDTIVAAKSERRGCVRLYTDHCFDVWRSARQSVRSLSTSAAPAFVHQSIPLVVARERRRSSIVYTTYRLLLLYLNVRLVVVFLFAKCRSESTIDNVSMHQRE